MSAIDDLAAKEREGCCEKWPKPCGYHEGLIDGIALVEDYINAHFDEIAAALQTPEPMFDARIRLDMALSVAFGVADPTTGDTE